MPRAYYNENNKHAAEWLRNLIADGLIPYGHVDDRSIADVRPGDLAGYTQCHFFAGIGGWGLALRLAGWPDERPIWTGSCPCQPFSIAGKGAGFEDPRDLFPTWFGLVRACRPPVVMGEQVARKAGAVWFARTRSSLEGIGYAARGVVVPACAVEAPHERERLWFVAHADAITSVARRPGDTGEGADGRNGHRHTVDTTSWPGSAQSALGDTALEQRALGKGECRDVQKELPALAGTSGGFWSGAEWLQCADGKQRRLAPRVALLAHGLRPRDVAGSLAGFGNAIVPQVAAEIIAAFADTHPWRGGHAGLTLEDLLQ